MAFENYVSIDGPLITLSVLRSKSFCPKVWFGLAPFEKLFVLTRNGGVCSARFRSAQLPVDFYKKLQEQYPDIRITYEYLSTQVAAHGSVPGPETKHYYFSNQELISLKSARQWKLNLDVDSKQLIKDFISEIKTFDTDDNCYDYDGDYIMKFSYQVCCKI